MQLRSLLIRLHLAHGIGYAGMVRVLQHCRQVQTVVTDPRRLGKLAHLTASQQGRFTADWQSMAFQQRLKRHAQLDILTILDDDYPPALLEAYQPPLVLFLRGQRALATAKLTIVSGLAKGADGFAHRTALRFNLPTIGVIGTGLDISYPRQHRDLQQQISQVGLLISEYPLGVGPEPYHFVARNRIIAGLCQTVIVVEAQAHSGSLITANIALQNNRNVLAVPGPIDAPFSVGCNQLIVAGAKPVLNSRHIIEEFLPKI
ncbi:DNA-processing protein DprA [Lactiplantibacillus plantarum]|uniref:DNA-processing protein DprA n=1 Tax=Lactiplantibacillus plantarum TaxID=1590 RepID=UPI0004698076|nr:DNA-processing protein DprA [Lactiplantibacillus plantarum]AZN83147.1 DNA-processing protein DprA [Lactiplantibacillus plantarum subsp. plantarum]KIN22065.1 DNA processing protein [Lactiplantibacillus plantarum]KZU60146.1 Rossmann fold nucleotide-binding protein Smf involved in DNA uptake [Lactiplantibacillus plantarum]MCT1224820.1 DNA-processing protein DprA [Lactiplantibacillus plantarum]MCT3229437.1 DNA-processing protein DprA [Lactiplantibacillus plantarum]